MATITSAHQDKLISTFVEIAVGHTIETAIKFLKATNWDLEDAINLFLVDRSNQPLTNQNPLEQYSQDEEQTPPPLPSRRDTLYDDPSMYRQTSVPVSSERIWNSITPSESDSSGSDSSEPESRLSSLYRPPIDLLFKGLFHDAKSVASKENQWLLVNLQSETEFASHALNRDLWSNEAVSQAIKSSFILLQVYDGTREGQKVSSYYKIDSVAPVILLIDPITGQKMRTWSGTIDAHSFAEDLMKFMDSGPSQYIASLTSNKRVRTEEITCSPNNKRIKIEPRDLIVSDEPSVDCATLFSEAKEETYYSVSESEEEEEEEEEEEDTCVSRDMFEFMVLTEEPKEECERSLVCSICVRYPDGRRKQRKFLKTEPVQLLWSFCYAHMEESERKKEFKLVQAIPGASKTLDYEANETFEQSGLANSMISVTWE